MANVVQKIFGQIETKEQFDALRISIASQKKYCPGQMVKLKNQKQ